MGNDRLYATKLTLERIKVAKRLVEQQVEFIGLARAAGYEPVLAPKTLQHFRSELSQQRMMLTLLTRVSQREFGTPNEISQIAKQRAA